MSSKKIITYTGLLSDVYYKPKDIDNREVLQLLRQAESIPQRLLPFNGIIHLIDYSQHKHVALSGPAKEMTGFDPQDIMEGGLDFVINIFQKDDFKIFNESIFPKVTEFLKKTPQAEHGQYLFTYSYRMKKSDGKWMQMYQQGSYITDPKTRLPLFSIALVADITTLKRDTSMIFSIDKKPKGGDPFGFDNILVNHYYPNPDEARLSRREKEILGRLAEGLSSKEIAAKLHLSESTIVNHRKNMMKKTNTKNVAELIRCAINKGII